MGKAWPALEIYAPECDPELHELIYAELDTFQPTAIHESDGPSPRLHVFFPNNTFRDEAASALAAAFGIHVFVRPVDVDDEDWAARSQAQLRAIVVGRLTVAPPWDASGDRHSTIVIRPSMGFGTGHHATTRLALRALQTIPLQGRSVLDIGCGSGVLAIAAAKLGARSAAGVDIDPDAIANARENADLNDLSDRVTFEVEDFRQTNRHADVALANLTGALLEQSAGLLAQAVGPNGCLIVSGFMDVERTMVLTALEAFLDLKQCDQEQEWLCAVFQSRQA